MNLYAFGTKYHRSRHSRWVHPNQRSTRHGIGDYFRVQTVPATSSIPVASSTKVFGSGVNATVSVKCATVSSSRLIIACPVSANGAVTLGPPKVAVGPAHWCRGEKVQGNVVETAVAPVGPGVSVLSLRSHPRKVSVPLPPSGVVKPECVAESVWMPMVLSIH